MSEVESKIPTDHSVQTIANLPCTWMCLTGGGEDTDDQTVGEEHWDM